ncbi:MAG: DoxX family protein, partial [Bacteroidales bacterium]|nr:DoxX family protein [Bacteroidales bacterium]
FINRNRYHEWIGPIGEILLIIVMAGFIGIFQSSNLNNLPLIDFRPYKIGNNIPALMTIPEDAPQDIYESVFYYEKDGVKHRYNSVEDIPADPGKFINRDTRLIQKGYEPPIHDFSIVTRDGADITNDVLHSDGYVFLLIAYDLKKSNPDYFDQINEIARFVINRGNRFIALTASLDDEIDAFTDLVGADYPFCTTDQITLKTIIRSNPGLVMLKNGTIINKWHYKHLPDLDKLASEIPSFK